MGSSSIPLPGLIFFAACRSFALRPLAQRHRGHTPPLQVADQDEKPRGYAFIEYEREADMREAYKRSDGRKIDGRRVVVDVERGRTVRKWRPRRFGGGLGQTRKGGKEENVTVSGRSRCASPCAAIHP